MKLQVKLTFAFVIILLVMGIIQSVLLQTRIQSTFQNYLEQHTIGYMERMKQTLELYYQETGSWDNAQELFFSPAGSNNAGHGMMMHGMTMNAMMAVNVDFLLIDLSGKVIADSGGTRIGLNGKDLKGNTQDLVINGTKQGTLLFQQHSFQNLEKEFLQSANSAILISGLLAVVTAVLLSIWIARKISNPLSKLMIALKRITNGDKVGPLSISSKDEFHELGAAFNDMSKKLERNEEVRKSLVADVAHELRTPLTILQGKLESIQEGAIAPTEETVLELTDEVYRLNRLVSDLQQLSLAEAGKLPLNRKPINLRHLIERICGTLKWLADEKNISLKFDHLQLTRLLEADPDRLTQVFVNLIGNALRHTPIKGVVEITAVEKEQDVFIYVRDSGPGIPKEVLPFIFDRFYKRDSSRSRNESGSGLGLSIAKGYVEAHGGDIQVESEENKGSVFTVRLPYEKKILE